jgi:N-methylhydantoinase B
VVSDGHRDGTSTGGSLTALGGGFNDVELHESQHPLLYLWRREMPDSGGAGRHRGGNGVELALAVYDSPQIMSICGTQGAVVPTCIGVFGGHPGGTSLYDVVQQSDWKQRYEQGSSIGTLDDLRGERHVPDAKSTLMLGPGDVVNNVTQNAGGFGDPLDRPLEQVVADLVGGHVTPKTARELYGVVLDGDRADETATTAERERMRSARLKAADNLREHYDVDRNLPVVESWGGVLDLVRGPDGILVRATDSGAVLGQLDGNWRALAPSRRLTAEQTGATVRIDDRLEVRQYLDPITGRSLWIDCKRIGDEDVIDFELIGLT